VRRLTFRRCGYAGVAAAAALALVLAGRVGVSLLLEAGLIVTACLGFLALAYVTRVVAGRERLVYYHHEIAVLALVALVAGLAGGPVLSALDATALGLGLFLACGRVGCLVAGCCHGRPARHGIVYGPDHAENGFTRHLVGVPLIPVQAIESALVVALVAAGAALTLSGAPPGTGFTLYVTGYAVIRFGLEFLRGDPLRPYWRGASEAQWTSTLLACLVALAAVAGVVPEHPWDIVAAAALLAALAGTVTRARRPPAVLHPRHLQEVVRTVAALSSERPGGPLASAPAVFHTSAGVQLSCGVVDDRLHVAMSRGRPALDLVGAQALACVIGGLRPRAEMECVVGPEDVWHVLLRG
jgi:prolipoprotein diacylglyceryltransferase